MKNKQFISIFFIILMIFSFIPLNVSAETSYQTAFFDNADLISAENERDIIQMAEGYKDLLEMDIVFVTTNNANGKSSMEYADDFYDGIEGGHEYYKDGILFLIDLDNGYVEISTSGRAIRLMSDDEIDDALDAFDAAGGKHNYPQAIYSMAEDALSNMKYWMSKGADSIFYYIMPSGAQLFTGVVFMLGLLLILYKKHNSICYTIY